MLQSIRDRATGVFAWVIVILLIVPFALWGIQEYLGGGSAVVVAKVNDTKITRNALNAQVDRELRGRKDRPEGAALVAFRRNALEQMIREEVLIQSAGELGIIVPELAIAQQIHVNPAFQVDGRFDQERYEALLRNNGLDPASYESLLQRNMVLQQLVGGIQQSSFVTTAEIDRLLELQGRQLKLAYLQIPISQYRDAIKLNEDEIQAYYDSHKQNFVTPEEVSLSYLMLDSKAIENSLQFSDEELQQFYKDNKDSFLTPEQRQVAHIQVSVAEDASEAEQAAAEKRINEVYQQLEQGGDFTRLAAEYSDDSGSSSLGGDIGIIEAGTLDPAFEAAAAGLAQGEYSTPVRSAFGYHIIKVIDIKPGTNKAFADVRDDVRKLLARQRAENLYLDRKESLYNLTYENPDSLDVAAREMGLEIQHTGWFSRSGLKDDSIASEPKVIEAAFSDDVFADGDPQRSLNSKIIELKPARQDASERVVVIRLRDYRPSQSQSLQSVSDEISNTLKNKKATQAMDADIDTYLKQLEEGKGLESLATEKSLSLKAAQWVGRNEKDYPPTLLTEAFKAVKPVDGKPTFISAHTLRGDGVVAAISESRKGEVKAEDPSRNFMTQFMQSMRTNEELAAFVDELKQHADIEIFESRLAEDDS